MNVKNPLQIPRLPEIMAGKKFWGYLDTEALQTRYVLAAHFMRGVRNVVEIGGYRNNVITNFLTSQHDSVTVFSLDAEFEPREAEGLNGAPCRVRHVQDYFQPHLKTFPSISVGLVALGLEIHGDHVAFHELVRRTEVAVLEVPVEHRPSLDCLDSLLAAVPRRIRCQISLDLSRNAPLLEEELSRTNMNVPFWKRNLYVLEAAD
jgi:hypothetical protein